LSHPSAVMTFCVASREHIGGSADIPYWYRPDKALWVRQKVKGRRSDIQV
jgi:hypothetical protein